MSIKDLCISLDIALKDYYNAKVISVKKAIYLKFESGELFKLTLKKV